MDNSSRIQEEHQKFEIIFDGIKHSDPKTSFLRLKNSVGTVVDIPIDRKIADHILIYLAKISLVPLKPVEHSENEP